MDQRFYEVFKDLYDVYERPSPVLLSWLRPRDLNAMRRARLAREAIEDGLRRSDGQATLRPDARLALLVNVNELVVKPLAHPEARGPRLDASLSDFIREDVGLIVRAAREMRPNRGMLSAADIFIAVGQVYDRLRVSSLDLWG